MEKAEFKLKGYGLVGRTCRAGEVDGDKKTVVVLPDGYLGKRVMVIVVDKISLDTLLAC